MAEYLDPRDGYTLVTFPDWQAPQPYWVEVPEGAEIYGYPTNSTLPYFHKAIDGQNWYYSSMNHNWSTSGHPIGAFDRIHWQRATLPEELPFIDNGYNPFGYGDGADDTQDHYNSGQPPAHFVVQPKPRVRLYATLVHKVEITVVVPMPPQKITLNFSVGAHP